MATFKDMNLTEVLDDLTARFIINVPNAELAAIERICFQIEQAHWYYQDFVRVENPSLPSISLKSFCAQILKHCPLLHTWAENHEDAFADFMKYKLQVPVCGAIILNPSLDKILLVKGWKSKTWSFPKGKINQNEKEVDCAIREVLEETGLDITHHLCTTGTLPRAPQAPIHEPDHVERNVRACRMRLYFAENVPESTHFQTQTINEISEITWHPLSSVLHPHRTRFHTVGPFIEPIRTWVHARRATLAAATTSSLARPVEDHHHHHHHQMQMHGAMAAHRHSPLHAGDAPPAATATATAVAAVAVRGAAAAETTVAVVSSPPVRRAVPEQVLQAWRTFRFHRAKLVACFDG